MTFPIGNITIVIEWQSLILTLLIAWSAYSYIAKQQKKANLPAPSRFVILIICIAALLSLVFHELAHAAVAVLVGDSIDKAGITGWGAYVQTHNNLFELTGFQQIAISIVGPLTNLLLGTIFYLIVKKTQESTLENSVQYLAWMNLEMGLLNLLPIYVLDGGHVLHGLISLFVVGETSISILTGWLGFFIIIFYLFLMPKHWRPNFEKILEAA